MLRRASIFWIVLLGLSLSITTSSMARWSEDYVRGDGNNSIAAPAYCIATHNIGKLEFGVVNNGSIGVDYSASGPQDCFTGERVVAMEYPKGSNTRYLFGAAFWIGAVVGRDTLVSVGQDGWTGGQEFHPAEDKPGSNGKMVYRSTIDPTKPEYEGAISEQDYICVYTDTFTSGVQGLTNDAIEDTPHKPIGLEVTQRSFAWSYSYADDFVLFDYKIRNIGQERLKRVFLGIYVDADVHGNANTLGYTDDVCGFLDSINAAYLPVQCPDKDNVNLAWIADNDGDLTLAPGWEVPHVTGVRIVRAPKDSLEVSFNWWVGNGNPALDFGPHTFAKYRDYSTGGMGTPEGDRNKYHVLSNGEFDYDQVTTATRSAFDSIFMQPNESLKEDLADGFDTRYLLSFGPFDIEVGQILPLSFAYVAGENLHKDPNNGSNLPYNPEEFYKGLSFDSLGQNATWAEWIYDNPGVDTDSDGYAGEFYLCTVRTGENELIKTIARRGDGVPDFKGANPPPAPIMRVIPSIHDDSAGTITIRWNGARSETAVDNFSGEIDFEGYRVYVGRDERLESLTMTQSYDFENYNKWEWDDDLLIGDRVGGFKLEDAPLTIDSLRCLYADNGCNDSSWNPLDYDRNSPFPFGPELFYFEPQDFNQSVLANEADSLTPASTLIRKVYPNSLKPQLSWLNSLDSMPDSIPLDTVMTSDGYFKFYEYELTLHDLLPTVPYNINVTAFDYGSPKSGLPSLESSPMVNPAIAYAIPRGIDVDTITTKDMEVYVWPNPYRLDAGYSAAGLEATGSREDRNQQPTRARRIHFGNLPSKCTISIFTLDGDLVRVIEHDMNPTDADSSHDYWDLITRNTQLAVSGLYYWTIESEGGKTQIGKVAIIM